MKMHSHMKQIRNIIQNIETDTHFFKEVYHLMTNDLIKNKARYFIYY